MTQETKNAKLSAANLVYIINNGNSVLSGGRFVEIFTTTIQTPGGGGTKFRSGCFLSLHLNATQVYFITSLTEDKQRNRLKPDQFVSRLTQIITNRMERLHTKQQVSGESH